ncbi:hydrolase or metal-binding protein [Amphritea sp. 1_MG-2023]|uniref:recombination directionality factor n=1 Tax=Amphritea sp. 1_MG-2023 TaxID=3062670 RepID=UPI0026E1D0F9|nr:hydrolase or metal-binding protein [Amphritea sp. 1_MG-2023]MDO6562635.1 hydrolase or metal-binding protein [Amphritea sp. 1_MG-2023]
MLKGLAITPPILGRIAIGKVIEKDGKRLPQKDDQFTLTSQVQTRNGWLPHPLDESLRETQGDKLRQIPIRLLFNEPELNLRAEYSLFDRNTARPLCVGDGEQCRRRTPEGMQSLPCPSPDGCELAQGGRCKPYARLNVVVGDEDPLGTFIFRTTGFNSIRTLAARLQYFKAISDNKLACLPLALRLRGKSTRQSHGTPIYYVDITLREGMDLEEALAKTQQMALDRHEVGFNQEALDQAARLGFANGDFEEQEEDAAAIVEEFYPHESEVPANTNKHGNKGLPRNGLNPEQLTQKLVAKSKTIRVTPSAPHPAG